MSTTGERVDAADKPRHDVNKLKSKENRHIPA
jgi:hypothetical protein